MKKIRTLPLAEWCPFGCYGSDCHHFMGWTDDGQTYQPSRPVGPSTPNQPLQPENMIVKTGVTTRVYRKR